MIYDFEEWIDSNVSQIYEAIDEANTNVSSIDISGVSDTFKTLIDYATGVHEFDYEIGESTILERQNSCIDILIKINTKLCVKFGIEITVDYNNELKKVFDLFVIDRNDRIAEVISFIIGDEYVGDFDDTKKVAQEVTDLILNSVSLSENFEYYYMEKLQYFHDKIWFDDDSFFKSFFCNEEVSVEEIINNDEIINKVKSKIIQKKLKQENESK